MAFRVSHATRLKKTPVTSLAKHGPKKRYYVQCVFYRVINSTFSITFTLYIIAIAIATTSIKQNGCLATHL